MSEQPLSTKEAGVIAGKHKRTIVAWIRKGLLPAMKLPGKRGPYLINREDLERTVATLTTPKPYHPEKDN